MSQHLVKLTKGKRSWHYKKIPKHYGPRGREEHGRKIKEKKNHTTRERKRGGWEIHVDMYIVQAK